MIDCKHWRDCGVSGGGCCALQRFGGTPSHGCCAMCLRGELVTPTISALPLPPISEPAAAAESESAAGSFVSRAIAYAKAEASLLISGPVSDDEFAARVSACAGCSELNPLPAPQVGWCKACGCGDRSRAELSVKATMPAATCPRGKWPK